MGKDRTGVGFAVLLSLAHVSKDLIATEYSLSEQHLEHLQPRLLELLKKTHPEVDAAHEIARFITVCRYGF